MRQHPIVYGGNKDREDFFVADFYCHEKKLVIELDGGIHNEQKLYDENRDEIINELGIHVLRMKNEIMEKPTESLNTINDFILDNNL